MFDIDQHHRHSVLREKIVEHLFVGEALRMLWRYGIVDVEILRSEFDAYGYDLVISAGSLVRHIQLKTGTRMKRISVSRMLAEKPSGCVVFIEVNDYLELGSFYTFSSEAGLPLPDLSSFKATKRTTPNSQGEKPLRINHADIPVSRFSKHASLKELLSFILGREMETVQDGQGHIQSAELTPDLSPLEELFSEEEVVQLAPVELT